YDRDQRGDAPSRHGGPPKRAPRTCESRSPTQGGIARPALSQGAGGNCLSCVHGPRTLTGKRWRRLEALHVFVRGYLYQPSLISRRRPPPPPPPYSPPST